VLGGLLFMAPIGRRFGTETLTGFLLAMIYMMSSVWGILNAWPIFAQARIALDKVHKLGNVQARRYLGELELDAKVQITAGALSTTSLSHGRRKRLALLTAFLEDRPIYVSTSGPPSRTSTIGRSSTIVFYTTSRPAGKPSR
jgi:ABC-type siderophore export system fused ATPase/permease subunit